MLLTSRSLSSDPWWHFITREALNNCYPKHVRKSKREESMHRNRVESASPLPAQPYPERDHHRTRQPKPGDGVLQVIVLEMNLERAGFWHAAGGHGGFQIDVERRDRAPAQRAPHGQMIPSEPQPFCEIFRWRQRAGAFRNTDV